jgi:hypothetical protein
MRRAIELGLNFFEWRRRQPKQLDFSDAILQVSYESLEEDHTYRREYKKEYIVLNEKGSPLERKRFILHQNIRDASEEGRSKAGEGKFIIENFTKFKRTARYRSLCNLHVWLRNEEERLRIKKLNNTSTHETKRRTK